MTRMRDRTAQLQTAITALALMAVAIAACPARGAVGRQASRDRLR
jgi:hypothetical protein